MKRRAWLAGAALTLGALTTAPAQAGNNVYWSIGVHSPGVSTTISNARPIMAYPAPTVVYPAPTVVYPAPPVMYAPAPVLYAPRPVYVQPAPVVVYPGHGPGHWHKHRHGHRHEGWRGHHRGWDD